MGYKIVRFNLITHISRRRRRVRRRRRPVVSAETFEAFVLGVFSPPCFQKPRLGDIFGGGGRGRARCDTVTPTY